MEPAHPEKKGRTIQIQQEEQIILHDDLIFREEENIFLVVLWTLLRPSEKGVDGKSSNALSSFLGALLSRLGLCLSLLLQLLGSCCLLLSQQILCSLLGIFDEFVLILA